MPRSRYLVEIMLDAKGDAQQVIQGVASATQDLASSGSLIGAQSGRITGAIGSLINSAGMAASALGLLAGPQTALVIAGITAVINVGLKAADAIGGVLAGAFRFAVRAVRAIISPILRFLGLLRRIATGAAVAGVAISVAFGISAIRSFASYEQAVTNAATVTGLLGAELELAKVSLFNVGIAVSSISSKAPEDVAEALYSMGSAGFTVEEQMRAVWGVVALTEATMSEMGVVSELVTSTMRAFGLQASDTNRIVNVLAATIASSRMNIERLSVSLPFAAATARGFNVTLEQTSAALAVLANNGLQASMAGTGLRAVLARLASPAQQARDILEQYGLTVADVSVQQRGLFAVLRSLQAAGIPMGDLFQLFDLRAANAAAILIRNAGAELEGMAAQITGTNRAFEMQREQRNTVSGQWEILKGTWQTIKTIFGAGIADQGPIRFLNEFLLGLLRSGAVEQVSNLIGDKLRGAFQRLTTWLASGQARDAWQLTLSAIGRLTEAGGAMVNWLARRAPAAWQTFITWSAEGGRWAVKVGLWLLDAAQAVIGFGITLADVGADFVRPFVDLLVSAAGITATLASSLLDMGAAAMRVAEGAAVLAFDYPQARRYGREAERLSSMGASARETISEAIAEYQSIRPSLGGENIREAIIPRLETARGRLHEIEVRIRGDEFIGDLLNTPQARDAFRRLLLRELEAQALGAR
jgi:TP901 family phage tail tape measure protein